MQRWAFTVQKSRTLWTSSGIFSGGNLLSSSTLRGRGGGWHEAMALVRLPLAAPIGLSPLQIPILRGSERVLVWGGLCGSACRPRPVSNTYVEPIPSLCLTYVEPCRADPLRYASSLLRSPPLFGPFSDLFPRLDPQGLWFCPIVLQRLLERATGSGKRCHSR